ncbi:MAG: HYR domain-containing protein [Chitinophagaceae bacterium]
MKTFLLLLSITILYSVTGAQTIRYVKPVATGTGDGSSWANASGDLQAMINAGAVNDQVWVAAGDYIPAQDMFGNTSPVDPGDKTFLLKNGVSLYGGFAGNETSLAQRNIGANATYLDAFGKDFYHVLVAAEISSLTNIDGFYIMGGVTGSNRTVVPPGTSTSVRTETGGGLCAVNCSGNLKISSCTFNINSALNGDFGGAVYLENCSKADFASVKFEYNDAYLGGGGVYMNNCGDISVQDCFFYYNVSYHLAAGITGDCNKLSIINSIFTDHIGGEGGAVYILSGIVNVTNSVFANNNSTECSGIYIDNGSVFIANSIFLNNTIDITYGRALLVEEGVSSIVMTNSIIDDLNGTPAAEGNVSITYSNIEGGFPGTGNINAEPLYVNKADMDGPDNIWGTADDGLALLRTSPSVNTGNNAGIPPGVINDITARPRIANGIVDMGPYEGQCFIPAAFSNCPANITANTAPGQCGAAVNYTATATGSATPVLTYTFSGATTGSGSGTGSGSFFNKGVTTVTISAENFCNIATCIFTVTVADNEPPVINTCAPNITVNCAGAVPAADISQVSATDNCGPVTILPQGDVISNITCANRFTITRTYLVTDGAGNSSSCTQLITVNDQTAPVITCPPALTVGCAANVPPPNTSQVTVSENCGGYTVTHVGDVISNQTCANRYTITRTYRVTDDCGNSAICTQIINVDDQTPPVITCPAPVTVSCASAVPAPDPASVTATDCGGPAVVNFVNDVISNQTCANRYTITRTYRATDVCGNSSTCTQIITVNDQTPPVITCPAPVTVSCAGAIPPPNTSLVTATDNCGGIVTISYVRDVTSNQTCANRFTITRTYRATDVCGNSSTCTQIITVNDQTPPVITCPAPVTVSCTSAVPAPNTSLVTATDNCGGIITITHVSDVISNQTCANRYTITRTYRATDVCGNSSTCTQIITVNDQTPPVITCPAPVTVSCAGAVPAPNTSLVTATDNCGGIITISHVSDVISNQTCANRYTITRTYRATDVCGNSSTCTQIITVNDQTPPVITCPAPVTVSCASAVPAPNTSLVTATDNCGGIITIAHVSDVISNQTCANRYTITRTYRATDVCGNSSTCTQIITVNDQTPPVITCPAPVTVSCAGDVPAPNTALVTATDNCGGIITITHVSDVISNQTCANRYTITRTYRATDVCGNSSTCTQIITVNDQTPPVITCPANITAVTPAGSCTVPVSFNVTATDNCIGTVTIVSVPASGTAFPIGITTVTSTATDVCGNSSTCTFTVTVTDGQLPVITAQPFNQVVCEGADARFSVTAETRPNTGGPLSFQWQQWNGTSWADISGATASVYQVNNAVISMNTSTYRCVIRGLCSTVNSAAATLYVKELPQVNLQPTGPVNLLPNQQTGIRALVNPPGGSFVWSLNGVVIGGVNGDRLSPIGIDGQGVYQAVYTDPNGCVTVSGGIIIGAQAGDKLWVYPNPNQGRFQVRYYNTANEKLTLLVYNAAGQKVFQKQFATTGSYTKIDVELGKQFGTGMYVVELLREDGSRAGTKEVLIQR